MAGWRQAVELAVTDEAIASLTAIARSRNEAAHRVKQENPSFFTVDKTGSASPDGSTLRNRTSRWRSSPATKSQESSDRNDGPGLAATARRASYLRV